MSYELSHLDALEAESLFIIREVAAELDRPVLLFSGGKDSFDVYRRNRHTGSFILIDEATNATVGAGMINGLAA